MYRRANPNFTNWVPKNAFEAVDRFTRCQRNGLKALMIPECLIECSKGLPEPELEKFEEWILNPNGLDYSESVPDDSIQKENEALYLTTLCEHGSHVPCLPPLPPVDGGVDDVDVDDEKIPDTDDARVQVIGDELLITGVSSKFAAALMCGAT